MVLPCEPSQPELRGGRERRCGRKQKQRICGTILPPPLMKVELLTKTDSLGSTKGLRPKNELELCLGGSSIGNAAIQELQLFKNRV